MRQKEIKQFISLLDQTDLIDIYSLGILMGVPNNEDFEDYVGDLLSNFYNRSAPERKALISLVEDIVEFRKKYDVCDDLSVGAVKRRVAELEDCLRRISEKEEKTKKPSFLKKFFKD